jgi:ABC-type dipeptide/oligopeptide/nickel transport system permease subunit
VLSRIIWGSRVSLIIGVMAVVGSAPVGVALGLIAGYYGRIADHVIMRIAIIAVLGPEPINLILVLGISGWVLYARIVRGEVLSVKHQPFVESARVIGLRDRFILVRYLLPNVMPAVIVVATFAVAYMILLESSLSFLGLGVQPPAPTWGGMLSEGREYISNAWWLSILPGLAIMLTGSPSTFLWATGCATSSSRGCNPDLDFELGRTAIAPDRLTSNSACSRSTSSHTSCRGRSTIASCRSRPGVGSWSSASRTSRS